MALALTSEENSCHHHTRFKTVCMKAVMGNISWDHVRKAI